MTVTRNSTVKTSKLRNTTTHFLKWLSLTWNEYQSSVLYSFLFALIYAPLHSFIALQLNKIWVNPILSLFQPGLIFDVFFLTAIITLAYLYREKRLKGFDFVIIYLYVYYAHISKDWTYWKMFKNDGGIPLRYMDGLGLFYICIIGNRIRVNLRRRMKKNLPIENYLQIDSPITGTDFDTLGRKRFAKEIVTILQNVVPSEQSFAIGICGSWGTGKTSLLHMVAEDLHTAENRDRFAMINFSPWLFNDIEVLMNRLFSELEKHFSKSNRGLANELKAYSKTLGRIEENVLNSKVLQIFSEEKRELSERSSWIRETLKAQSKYLVIFIDDLDRLNPKEIVEVLRLIRVVADFPKTFYLVGYDREYIDAAVAKELISINADKFIDKVFNFEFKLPELTPDTLGERLKDALSERISQNKRYPSINKKQVERCFSFEDLGGYIRTERDIKRFLNSFLVRYLLIKEEVNFYYFFLLELLHYYDPSAYRELFHNRRSILNPHFKISTFVDNHDLQKHRFLLQSLFPDRTDDDFPINSRFYFYTYFQLSLTKGTFSEKEFRLSFDKDDLGQKLIEFNTINSGHLRNRLLSYVGSRIELAQAQLTKIQFALIDLLLSMTSRMPASNADSLQPQEVIYSFYQTFITRGPEPAHDLRTIIMSYPNRMNLKVLDLIDKRTSSESFATNSDFPEIHLMLLEEYLSSHVDLNEELLLRILHLSAFVLKTDETDSNTYSPDWFKKNVLIRCKENFRDVSNLMAFVEKINAIKDPQLHLIETRKVLREIFYDFNGVDLLVDPDGEISERVKLMMIGQQITHQYNYQVHKDIATTPDGIYDPVIIPLTLEVRHDREIQIEIRPQIINSPWMFGIRIAETEDMITGEQGAFVSQIPMLVLIHNNQINRPGDPDNQTAFEVHSYLGETKKNHFEVAPTELGQALTLQITTASNGRSRLDTLNMEKKPLAGLSFPHFSPKGSKSFQFLCWGTDQQISLGVKITEIHMFL
ncbi:MAG: hypothetical protein DI535_07970 [Citrobacter freundii]|nr:MAG: hypothetical protein DI535_07970 [Citrobacter freundii]